MISVMSNDCELEKKSEVSDNGFPTFELETPDDDDDDDDDDEEEEAGIPIDMVVDKTQIDEGVTKSIMRSDESEDSSSDLAVVEDELEDKVETGTKEDRGFSEMIDGKSESRVSEIKDEAVGRNDCFAVGDNKLEELETTAEEGDRNCSGETMGDKPNFSDFNYAYSRVDEGTVARMTEAFGSEAARALSYGFEPGDMVWGKVKSHPWWPGHIFSEAFASPSVRRTKRAGHLLVAFFGDSSYGWFDTAELVPFEPHYAEKSQQTHFKIFVKAVEEAVDEARRRAALGLTCYCRNPFNFRPTTSQGYFYVDVSGFEPGGLYSVKQIKKARENFQPREALSFVQQLAVKPRNNEERGIDWIKNVSLFIAYRKATFEEFDETYTQAFGVQPVRPNDDSMAVSDQLAKLSSRAPLSGPMVFAEALGEVKSSTKPSKVKDQSKKGALGEVKSSAKPPKVKDQSKKDKYVLKRREKPNESKTKRLKQGHVGLTAPSAFKEGAAAMAPGDYIFQKRTPTVSVNPQVPVEQEEFQGFGKENATLVSGETQQEAESNRVDEKINMDQFDLPAGSPVGLRMIQLAASSSNSAVQGDPEGGNMHIDKNMDVLPEMNGRMASVGAVGPISTGLDGSILLAKLEHPAIADSFGLEKESKVVGLKQKKKAKIRERPEKLNSDKTSVGEKKKKKKKKVGPEGISEHAEKPFRNVKDIESLRKSPGKSIAIGLVPGENSSVDPQRKHDTSSFLSSSALLPKVDLGNNELELPQLVTDLLALALDPFHGVERNSPEIVRHVFLQFRSLVYQKSLVLVPASDDAETSEFLDGKTPAGPSKLTPGNDATDSRPKKPKSLARPDDPTKAGRKRSPSERQEEKSAKRFKKLKDLKSLSTEKKAGNQKISEEELVEKKEVVGIPSKLKWPDTVKRQAPSVRVAEPMMLSMKFPPRTTLPSVPELKAKFARFGPLDPSAFRVFWKSSTCRVVFKYKAHAQAAYRFAVQNKGFFGQVNVNYLLKDVAAQAPEGSETAKRRADDAFDDIQPFRSEVGEQRRPPPQPSPIQLKSCLKKPSGEDTGSASGVPRENPRVKFMLGGEESSNGSRGEQLMSSSVAKVGVSSSSASSTHAMDVNRTNFQKVIPSTLPPLLPLPSRNLDFHHESRASSSSSTHYAKKPCLNFSQVEEPRKPSNFTSNPTTTPTTTTTTNNNKNNNKNNIDISSQMLSLMVRCNDIIMDVKSSLGYVPYHPL